MLAHLGSLEIPFGDAADTFDYEGEIAVVIGKQARNIPPANAHEYIFGFSAFRLSPSPCGSQNPGKSNTSRL